MRKKGKFIWKRKVLHIILFCINGFTFMQTCVQIQFTGSLTEIEKHVKQHEA